MELDVMTPHSHRYVIEAQDEFGWFDHQFGPDRAAVIKEAEYLCESFPALRVVDRENQLVVWATDEASKLCAKQDAQVAGEG